MSEEPTGNEGTPGEGGSQDTGDFLSAMSEESRGYAANKGWDSPEKIVQSYRELERFSGGAKNLIQMPGDEATDEDRNAFYKALGRPDDVSGYVIDAPEGVTLDDNRVNGFKEAALKHGLTPEQAKGMAAWAIEFEAGAVERMQASSVEASEQAIEALKSEWGAEFDKNVASGQAAVRALGLTQDSLAAIETNAGTAAMMELMARIGQGMGEDKFLDGGGSGDFAQTPEAARAKIGQLMGDPAFTVKYLDPSNPGHKSALAEMERLQIVAARAS